ncbi:hypothetical protein [Azospirillum brasilense]|uniref:Uncharacterized protein n=1 Tax=Azospirillum brasilense TaxID=192 RepID=A0A235H5C4_AZOBR|nr:hypothetical protein [Azospirillum brasilense]OYD80959.1 hypothetical protein CHT98_28600 [Azospirillum brasilense]
MSVIFAIDPGLTGAIAKARYLDGTLRSMTIYDLPVVEKVVGKGRSAKVRRELDLARLHDLLDGHTSEACDAILEEVGAMPGEGAVGAFKFGATWGGIRGVLTAMHIPLTLVRPAEWKRTLRVPADKTAARARASELLPAYASNWPLKKHDGRAEAALLALWGVRHLDTDMAAMLS